MSQKKADAPYDEGVFETVRGVGPPGSTSASLSSSTRRSWLRLLLLAVVGSFNAEVVTYSSSLMNYFSPSFLVFGFGFYAVNIAFIEDLRTRLGLRLRHVLLLGLILGVLEEGWYVKTLTSPQAPITAARALDFNPLWALVTVPLHAVVTVGLTFLFVDLIMPRREPFQLLSRKHYAAALLYLAAAYAIITAAYVTFPSLQAVMVLVGLTVLCMAPTAGLLHRRARSGGLTVRGCRLDADVSSPPRRSDSRWDRSPGWAEWALVMAVCLVVALPTLQPVFALVPLIAWAASREAGLARKDLAAVVIVAAIFLHFLDIIAGLRFHGDYALVNYAAAVPVGVVMIAAALLSTRRERRRSRAQP